MTHESEELPGGLSYRDEPGLGRPGIIVTNRGVNGMAGATTVLLHTGHGETIDIGRFVCHINTDIPVRGVITHELRFFEGVLPSDNEERAQLRNAERGAA